MKYQRTLRYISTHLACSNIKIISPVFKWRVTGIKLFLLRNKNKASLIAQSVKNPPAMPETRVQSVPELGRSGEGNSNPFQYSYMENLMDGRAWWAMVQRSSESQTWLSDCTHTHNKDCTFSIKGRRSTLFTVTLRRTPFSTRLFSTLKINIHIYHFHISAVFPILEYFCLFKTSFG